MLTMIVSTAAKNEHSVSAWLAISRFWLSCAETEMTFAALYPPARPQGASENDMTKRYDKPLTLEELAKRHS